VVVSSIRIVLMSRQTSKGILPRMLILDSPNRIAYPVNGTGPRWVVWDPLDWGRCSIKPRIGAYLGDIFGM
jgi:hypothetical protein